MGLFPANHFLSVLSMYIAHTPAYTTHALFPPLLNVDKEQVCD